MCWKEGTRRGKGLEKVDIFPPNLYSFQATGTRTHQQVALLKRQLQQAQGEEEGVGSGLEPGDRRPRNIVADNRRFPFRPLLTSKPHASEVPLEGSLVQEPIDKLAFTEDGEPWRSFRNPYAAEIEAFVPEDWMLRKHSVVRAWGGEREDIAGRQSGVELTGGRVEGGGG